MTTTNATMKDRIVDAWHRAYALWETGQSTSPSATDLVATARIYDPTFLDTLTLEDAADRLFDTLCEGLELADAYDQVTA